MKKILNFASFLNENNARYVPNGAVTNPSYVITEYDYLAWAIEKAYDDVYETRDANRLHDLLKKALKESVIDSSENISELHKKLYNLCTDAVVEYSIKAINDEQFFEKISKILVDYGHDDFEDVWVGEPGSGDWDADEIPMSLTGDDDEDEDEEQLELPFNSADFTYDDMIDIAKHCINEYSDKIEKENIISLAKKEVDKYIIRKRSV